MSLVDKIKGNKAFSEYILKETSQIDRGFISTGSLSLNLLYSGRLDGGIPIGKISQIAAPSSLGKSFIGLKIAKNAQKQGLEVVYIDTEFAFDFNFARNIGLQTDNMLIIQNNHIEDVQRAIMQIFAEIENKDRDKLLVVIDSWGGLVTSKTTEDALSGKDVSDMTVSKKKNTLSKLMMGGPTVFVINQIYDSMDQYNPLTIGGGRGIYYASSAIVLASSKAKEKDGDGDVIGSIITATTRKSRFCKENTKLKYMIRYEGGIHPVYGILDDAIDGGFVIKPTMGWYSRPCIVGDKKWREREIWENWQEFWQPLIQLPEFKQYFKDKYSFQDSQIIDENFDFEN